MILIGRSPFAESLIHELTRLGIKFVQVVNLGDILSDKGRSVVRGDVGDEDVITQAGISLASAVVIVGESVTDKIAIAQSVKMANPNVCLVIVKNFSETSEQFSPVKADFIFSPETTAARMLANLLIGNAIPKDLQV